VVQILAIDMGTDLFPALALGMERPEPNIMQRPPRKRSQPLIDRKLIMRSFAWLGLIESGLCYLGFFIVLKGISPVHLFLNPVVAFLFGPLNSLQPEIRFMLASTVFQAGVVTAQIGNAFACRSEKGNVRWLGLFSNPFLLGGIIFESFLIMVMVYVQPAAREFGHLPLPVGYWVWLILFAPVLYILERIRKWFVRRKSKNEIGGK
jgi:P-type Ca2+ transporter type 2C